MRILISACLLGARCRYDGVSKLQPWISDLAERHILVPVCPEQLGGLPTPRPPAERRGDRVMTRDGGDVTAQYRRGAEEALRLCRLLGCEAALLKERSPSCGSGMVYDGTFTGVLTAGEGVTAELLRAQGIPVYGESRVAELADPNSALSSLRRADFVLSSSSFGNGFPINRPDSHGRRSARRTGRRRSFPPRHGLQPGENVVDSKP